MLEFENEGVPLAIQTFESPSSAAPYRSRLACYLHELALRPNDPPHDMDDPNAKPDVSTPAVTNVTSSLSSLNPEADSLYMETVLESLAVASGRIPVPSINEILRDGRFTRDKTKVGPHHRLFRARCY